MGRRKPDIINIEKLEIENEVEIDYRKLAEAICDAIQLSKKTDVEREKEEREDIFRQRMEYLGEKDFSHIRNWGWRIIRTILNRIIVFVRVLFVPKEIAKSISAVDSLFKLMTSFFLGGVRIFLYIVSVYLLVQMFAHRSIILLPYAIVMFIFAQLIRIAQIEVEFMEDREYLMTIAGTIIAVVSLIVAVLFEVI